MNVKKCMEWVARDKEVVAGASHLSYYPLVVESAKGATLRDLDGNEYIDFLSSASSLNLGSSNEVVTQAIVKQLENYAQYTPAYLYNTQMIEYAERLVSVFPSSKKAKVVFGNCGSDANDAAVKFSRAYTGRKEIITFFGSYHGNTYGSATLSAVTNKMRAKMGPFLPSIHHFPFFSSDLDDETVQRESTFEMERAFQTYLNPDEVAAIIIEPMQGDGGMLPAHPVFMKKLYDICKKYGILFISEEVQLAFFRTGKWFSIEHYEGIEPDAIILGKSIGGSLTLGAFVARSEIIDALSAPAHLFTLGGNALSCAAGIAAFDIYASKDFQSDLRKTEDTLKTLLENLKSKYPDVISNYRGMGISYGIIISKTKDAKVYKDDIGTFKILYRAYEKGLVIISLQGNVLRVQPPLTISDAELKKGFEILDAAIEDYVAGKIPDSVLHFQNGW